MEINEELSRQEGWLAARDSARTTSRGWRAMRAARALPFASASSSGTLAPVKKNIRQASAH